MFLKIGVISESSCQKLKQSINFGYVEISKIYNPKIFEFDILLFQNTFLFKHVRQVSSDIKVYNRSFYTIATY